MPLKLGAYTFINFQKSKWLVILVQAILI